MAAPSSIQRLEPFPSIAVELLNRIPLQIADLPVLHDLLISQRTLLEEVTKVAVQSGRCGTGQTADVQSLFEQVGSTELTEIAITVLVRGYMHRALSVSEDQRYWRYTLACAVCCEQVAGPGQEGSLLAYAAGLLHDIGRLALVAAYPDRYSNLLTLTDRMFASDQPFDLLEHERLLFGLDHFATGVWVADAWKLPAWLRSMVGKFDEQAAGKYAKLVAIVRAGTRLAHSLGFGYLQAAPRANIKDILIRFPEAWKHWKVLDNWQYGEEYMRGKIQSRFLWYGVPLVPEGSGDLLK